MAIFDAFLRHVVYANTTVAMLSFDVSPLLPLTCYCHYAAFFSRLIITMIRHFIYAIADIYAIFASLIIFFHCSPFSCFRPPVYTPCRCLMLIDATPLHYAPLLSIFAMLPLRRCHDADAFIFDIAATIRCHFDAFATFAYYFLHIKDTYAAIFSLIFRYAACCISPLLLSLRALMPPVSIFRAAYYVCRY